MSAIHPSHPDPSLDARISRKEALAGLLLSLCGSLAGWWMYEHPGRRGPVGGIFVAVCFGYFSLAWLRAFFIRGVRFSLGPEGVSFKGQTLAPIPWREVVSAIEGNAGDVPVATRYVLSFTEHGRSLLAPHPLGFRRRELNLTGIGYDVTTAQIGKVLAYYLTGADRSTKIAQEIRPPRFNPVLWLFSRTVGRTLDVLGIRNTFLRGFFGVPITALFFYALIAAMYGIKWVASELSILAG